VNDLLAGQLSNQDEDEVEDALEALEREVNGVKESAPKQSEPELSLPQAPSKTPERTESQKERWERRAREQREQQGAEPILA
jgi:charged multivesicular body protein 6